MTNDSRFVGDHTAGVHPFPSRTRKLSPAGPIVLHAKVCGRVGHRRHKIKGHVAKAAWPFYLVLTTPVTLGTRNLGEVTTSIVCDVSSENLSDGQPVYVRMALLIVGWAIAGLALYVLSTFLPGAV